MMDETKATESHGTLTSYSIGFVLSLVLTGVAYVVVANQLFSGFGLMAAIAALAFAQVLVQLFFFLHLGHETKPRLKLLVFLFMLLVLAIVVGGSLWIMQNLNYHMMPPKDMTNYIIKDEGMRH
jgi:cytochrome o ubiquinol oxidase operon protein cyoD